MCVSGVSVCACICLSLPSNQSFYQQITSYGMSVDVDRVMKGGHTNQLLDINQGTLDHVSDSCASQVMSCNYCIQCMYVYEFVPSAGNVEYSLREVPPKRRLVEVGLQQQPEGAEGSQGTVTISSIYYSIICPSPLIC